MKRVLVLLSSLLIVGCGSNAGSGYKQLPKHYTTLENTNATESFLIGINPAFQDPVAIRFEFTTGNVLRGVKTRFTYQDEPKVEELSVSEAHRIRDALLAFNWNHVQDPRPENEEFMHVDPLVITFKSRYGSVYREAVVNLTESKSIEALLYEIGVFVN